MRGDDDRSRTLTRSNPSITGRNRSACEGIVMSDALFIAFGVGFFVVGWLYLYACDRL
jgi:hypothetical protein